MPGAERALEDQRFPNPGRVVACFIHAAACFSFRSFTDLRSTPRESFPMPIGVTGGTGVGEVPRPKVSFTWPAKPPQQKHHPSPTPYQAMPHFTRGRPIGRTARYEMVRNVFSNVHRGSTIFKQLNSGGGCG